MDFEREALPHLSALYSAALRLTRNERDAEDLVQDAMLRGYRFFDNFPAGTNCKAWVVRTLTNGFGNRPPSAASLSMCLRYSSSVVAPITCSSPRDSAGFRMLAASTDEPAEPAPTSM